MKYFYDLHIHSDLSPCGNDDMTPNNIVNMSYIKGLNIISVTDHNTTENLPSVSEVCEKMGITSVPGIEVTTKEEVHVLCYFKALNDAMLFGRVIYDSLPDIKNIPSIFGRQNIYNSQDEVTGTLDKLLISASRYSLKEINRMSEEYRGIMIPAHINKKSNGILEILGFMPTDLNIKVVEIFQKEKMDEDLIKNYMVLKNSDAHILTDISEAENSIELDNAEKIYDYLNIFY
ncbi:MAG TPA: phosphoesterase [Clostridiales bacterium]|nr:phosphoesterase [Clostridiales bacterium]